MSIEHIVVDGSNIATEGRSLPSLAQLEEAVAELRREHPDAEVTVIVDATFAHRIDPSELPHFEEAALRGEYAHPPAGAIGRGDAFLLRVAEKVDGTVLSNDSFQEFHGEHPWLFERGRLLGATPVPGIGWIFTPRQPVRGPRSRQAVRETTQAKKRVSKALAVATKEVVEPEPQDGGGRSRRGRSRRVGETRQPEATAADKVPPLAVNDPLAFVSFIADHPLGAELEGEVESYTSHGAVVRVGEMLCYAPLANLGDPPPRSAREVLKRHETRTFVLTALDPQRRGAELALPGLGVVSGRPSEETVDAEVKLSRPPRRRSVERSGAALGPAPVPTAATPPPGRRPRKAADAALEPVLALDGAAEAAATEPAPPIRAGRSAKAAAKAPAPKPATRAKKAAAKPAPPAKAAKAAKAAKPAKPARPAKAPKAARPAAPAKAAKKAAAPASAPSAAPKTTKTAKTAKATKADRAAKQPARTAPPPSQSARKAAAPTATSASKATAGAGAARPAKAAKAPAVAKGDQVRGAASGARISAAAAARAAGSGRRS